MPDQRQNANASPRSRVPLEKSQRQRLRQIASDFVSQNDITAPASLDELKRHCGTIISRHRIDPQYADFTAICLNNCIWKDQVAAVPFDKRLLLLPRCLRHSELCPGRFDRFGLVCSGCGRCVINSIKSMAETLGYTVLIAEGSPMVMSLISSGQIQAVVGVSCMAVLEQAFSYMEAGAIPGAAVPLLFDGCKDTELDVEWLEEILTDFKPPDLPGVDLASVKQQIAGLFTKENLRRYFAADDSQTADIALEWMARSGKRFRPIIAASVFMTSRQTPGNGKNELPPALQDIAVAIECFHKASLVHDDIEDDDEKRYGQNTLHQQHGVPVALNTGDYLLGLGYKIIADVDAPDRVKVKMLHAASDAHYKLCIGQGNELTWLKNPAPLSVEQVIDIFRYKTSPAFEVAFRLGMQLCESDAAGDGLIGEYCKYLGIAYQVLDDINDFDKAMAAGKFDELKPSLLYALAWRDADSGQKKILSLIWSGASSKKYETAGLIKVFGDLSVKRKAIDMLQSFKQAAIEAISPVKNTPLKSLLRIVISRIFSEVEIMSCCDDYSPGNNKDS